MRKAVKLLLLGGVIGAAAVAVKSFRSEEQVENLPAQAAKSAGVGAAAGGLLGLVFDLRSRRKVTRRSRLKKATLGRLPSMPSVHIPRPSVDLHDLEKASRKARKAAVKAAHKARVKAEHLADASREKAEHLAEVGREKLAS